MSQTLKRIAALRPYQRQLLFHFFDNIEDKEKEVEEAIRDTLAYKLIEDGLDKELNQLFHRAEEMVKNFESWCEQEAIKLAKKGLDPDFTRPVILHATRQIRREAEIRLQIFK